MKIQNRKKFLFILLASISSHQTQTAQRLGIALKSMLGNSKQQSLPLEEPLPLEEQLPLIDNSQFKILRYVKEGNDIYATVCYKCNVKPLPHNVKVEKKGESYSMKIGYSGRTFFVTMPRQLLYNDHGFAFLDGNYKPSPVPVDITMPENTNHFVRIVYPTGEVFEPQIYHDRTIRIGRLQRRVSLDYFLTRNP